MADTKIKDLQNPLEAFNELTNQFRRLEDRFLAIAMDYKYYIDSNITDNEIYNLRDSVLYRLRSARFHFQLLLEHHFKIEKRLENLHEEEGPKEFFNEGFKLHSIRIQSTNEIYSLFDSIMYHLCSIFDYLFRLINYSHRGTILDKPKWNRFQDKRHQKDFIYCSEEITRKLEGFDREFVYPLIGHRSHLIHTENDIGDFTLNYNLSGKDFHVMFFATELFLDNFPQIKENVGEDTRITIKHAAIWLIERTIKTTTEILFELRDDMIRNKKQSFGFFAMIGENGTIQSPSAGYWGKRGEYL